MDGESMFWLGSLPKRIGSPDQTQPVLARNNVCIRNVRNVLEPAEHSERNLFGRVFFATFGKLYYLMAYAMPPTPLKQGRTIYGC